MEREVLRWDGREKRKNGGKGRQIDRCGDDRQRVIESFLEEADFDLGLKIYLVRAENYNEQRPGVQNVWTSEKLSCYNMPT